jgi:DNA replication and repair protein RecF
MILENLKLINFRNYEHLEINFSPEINFITGDNGSGKTNILEAISIISNLKSFRNINDNNIVKWNSGSYYCSGEISGSQYSKFEVGFSIQNNKPKKKIKIDSNEIKKISDYYGKLITVNFIPTDINIINGNPDIRRRYFDSVISKIYPEYIDELNKYREICYSRNLLLKKLKDNRGDIKLLDVWNRMIADKASVIIKKRKFFINKFNELFIKNYLRISNEDSSPSIKYNSTLKSDDYESIFSEVNSNIRIDIRRGNTVLGPHRDDYIINSTDGLAFINYASQGQKRTSSISLKLSEVEIIKEMKNKKCIILVDDIFSELDEKRRNSMIDLLQGEGQIIFTMVNHFYGKSILQNSKQFTVEKGIVSERTEI